ncbi:DUF6256 family protein [Streptomyces xiamenensis]|uniref:DUF6256 family protein n=1 Tax=Streptomyces xiamenensis TaxID=408015 RepID=UPI0036CB1783
MADRIAIGTVCAGYVLLMIYLATGVRIIRADPRARPHRRRPERRGRGEFLRQIIGTYVGGWLLLMVVIVGYYGGLARHNPSFVLHAVTGTLALMGLTLPLFLAASWAATRRSRRSTRPRRAPPPGTGP